MAARITPILMPKWGMEMSEGTITQWRCSPGSKVDAGDELVDIETSKIVNTLAAHEAGLLRRVLAKEGETLAVGALLAIQADASVPENEIDEFIAEHNDGNSGKKKSVADNPQSPISESYSTVIQGAGAVAEIVASGDFDDGAVPASNIARRLARRYGVNLRNIQGSGRHGRISKIDLEKALGRAGRAIEHEHIHHAIGRKRSTDDDRLIPATPVARRLARELGINLRDCRPGGTRGRVGKADVEAARIQLSAIRGEISDGAIGGGSRQAIPARDFVEVELSGVRKTIAARLQGSKQNSPHFRVKMTADAGKLLDLKKALNENHAEAKISLNDLLVKACAMALQRVPELNIQFDGKLVRRFGRADIAVAVALEEGLIAPIVRSVDSKGIITISNEIRDLTTRAKLGLIKTEELQGGTFSVSNLGMLGVKEFDAIINPPHGAILAIGAAEEVAVVRNGTIAVATMMTLCLSCDHRVIDGALAARFMASLKRFIEDPAMMLS